MKQQPQIQASGASETTRFFCTRISSAASAAGELCTTKRKEPDMGKRENEGKKEKKQKKERKEKRKQYRGLCLNPISVPRTRTRACEGQRNPRRHHRIRTPLRYALPKIKLFAKTARCRNQISTLLGVPPLNFNAQDSAESVQ